jgi:hypothetical protein
MSAAPSENKQAWPQTLNDGHLRRLAERKALPQAWLDLGQGKFAGCGSGLALTRRNENPGLPLPGEVPAP